MEIHRCFLLSYVKYGDHDAIMHCFSEENGYQSFFAKGLYTARNKKKPYLFPLNLLLISVPKKHAEQQIVRLSKIEVAPEFTEYGNVATNSVLFFIADFLNQVLREESTNAVLFKEIQQAHREIRGGNVDAYLAFLFSFLRISGVAPLESAGFFLNPETGLFENGRSHPDFDEQNSGIWQRYIKSENPYSIKLPREQRQSFLDSIMRYCQYHITGFQIPRSLAVVREIFE